MNAIAQLGLKTLNSSAIQLWPINALKSASRTSSNPLHVWLAKRWYGAGGSSRELSAQYAYIDGRIPVSIDYIFQASITYAGPSVDIFTDVVVRAFSVDEMTLQM